MGTVSSLATHPGILAGVACGVAGAVLQGLDVGVLWLILGFFAGKSLQSIYWTVWETPAS